MACDNESIQDLVNRVRKLLREITEIEHRVLMLENMIEKRRKIIDILREVLEKK